MIGRVAAALAGRDNVVGYDMLNEPEGDERMQLGPLYEDGGAGDPRRASRRDAVRLARLPHERAATRPTS